MKPKLLVGAHQGERNVWTIALVAILVGAGTGFVGALFRLALRRSDVYRDNFIAWAHGLGAAGFLLVVAAAALATGIAAWLVSRFSKESSGSGIPQVEMQLGGDLTSNPWKILPVKFAGGTLAIGAGQALGREGPSIQMGGSVARIFSKLLRCNVNESRVLLAAGAGAGLSTAFNSPLAGPIFVLEELIGEFDVPTSIATLGASACAMVVASRFLGERPDFSVASVGYPHLATIPFHVVLGLILGALGVLYNRGIFAMLDVTDALKKIPITVRALAIGALVGAVAWFWPGLVGGGDSLTQATLNGSGTITFLLLALAVRFALGPISYSARTPGGLFAPMLAVGSLCGLLYAHACAHFFPSLGLHITEFTIVAMAAFFAAVIRAPVTGIVLCIELTAGFTAFLPMLAACFPAMAVATLMKSAPVYDALRERAEAAAQRAKST